MKKTSFLKKLTAMAATLAMTCVMAVGAFAAAPAVDYKLDSAAISVGETWTMSVPAGGMYDWNLSSEYIAFGPSIDDKEGVLKQVGYETANGVSTITYEAMMPGTCTVTLTDRSFAKIAEATVTVTDGSAAPDTPSTDNKATETPAAASAPSAAAAVSTAPVDTRTAQQREIDEAKANAVEIVKPNFTLTAEDIHTDVTEVVKAAKKLVDLIGADFIVSVGRGISKDVEGGIKLAEELAEVLGGVVGGSRATIDSGWLSADHQVGQTGKTVHPKVYVALGISGAIQHKAGMQDSECIIAVNKNDTAPIFEIADYGICGDLFKVTPMLIEAIKAAKAAK